jgi:hypothetical protein
MRCATTSRHPPSGVKRLLSQLSQSSVVDTVPRLTPANDARTVIRSRSSSSGSFECVLVATPSCVSPLAVSCSQHSRGAPFPPATSEPGRCSVDRIEPLRTTAALRSAPSAEFSQQDSASPPGHLLESGRAAVTSAAEDVFISVPSEPHRWQHSSGMANAPVASTLTPAIASTGTNRRRCRRYPGRTATMASRKQIPAIHWWNPSSASQDSPSDGSQAITNGIAAQCTAQAQEQTTPTRSQNRDRFETREVVRGQSVCRVDMVCPLWQETMIWEQIEQHGPRQHVTPTTLTGGGSSCK